MADRLTQLQDCLDQLATQFYASIRYISTHHSPSSLPTQLPLRAPSPPPNPSSSTNNNNNPTTNSVSSQTNNSVTNPPASTSTQISATPHLPAATHELACDLLIKTSQIAYLISVLPGVENSAAEQEERIARLETDLRQAGKERRSAVGEMENWKGALEGVVGGWRR